MKLRCTSLAAALTLVCASLGYTQTRPTNPVRDAPDFSVEVWGYVVADFSTRIARYVELRTRLAEGLPALVPTDDPADITRAEVALARRIRRARDDAEEGEIFTPAISVEFRKALLLEMNAAALADIMEENPGDFSHRINGTYSKERVLSTVPSTILARLPRLPDDIQYRFLGPHLILHDTRANVILDRIPCAIQC